MKKYRSQVVHCRNCQVEQRLGNEDRPVAVTHGYNDWKCLILGSTRRFQVILEVGNILAESFHDEIIDIDRLVR